VSVREFLIPPGAAGTSNTSDTEVPDLLHLPASYDSDVAARVRDSSK
jgi:hypothetical protein